MDLTDKLKPLGKQYQGLIVSERAALLCDVLDSMNLEYTVNQPLPEGMSKQYAVIALDSISPGSALAELKPSRKLRSYGRTHAEGLAEAFHNAYEDLAPDFGYATREASRKPWADVPDQNKKLMVATANRILEQFPILQRGAIWEHERITERQNSRGQMWELDKTQLMAAEVHTYEPKPDPSLARIADSLESFAGYSLENFETYGRKLFGDMARVYIALCNSQPEEAHRLAYESIYGPESTLAKETKHESP